MAAIANRSPNGKPASIPTTHGIISVADCRTAAMHAVHLALVELDRALTNPAVPYTFDPRVLRVVEEWKGDLLATLADAALVINGQTVFAHDDQYESR